MGLVLITHSQHRGPLKSTAEVTNHFYGEEHCFVQDYSTKIMKKIDECANT